MKKEALIAKIKKDAAAPANSNTTAPTILRVGDVIQESDGEKVVVRVNDSRASVYPLGDYSGDSEGISPNSEVTVVRRLGVDGLLALLESKTSSKATRTPKDKSNDEPKLGKLGGYLGHTVVSVIRTLGKAGWEFKATREALDRVGVSAADQTLRIQLKAGRDGKGSYADLSKKDLALLAGKKVAAPKAPKASKAPAVEAEAQPAPAQAQAA